MTINKQWYVTCMSVTLCENRTEEDARQRAEGVERHESTALRLENIIRDDIGHLHVAVLREEKFCTLVRVQNVSDGQI